MAVKRRTGEDAFGKFVIGETYNCEVCNRPNVLVIRYNKDSLDLGEGIEVGKTILKEATTRIGINCGCYGKLHRQVAHIRHKKEERSGSKRQDRDNRDPDGPRAGDGSHEGHK